jgi:hypothetical protein
MRDNHFSVFVRVSFEFFPTVSTNIASFEIEFCKVSFDSADIQKTPPGYISWKSHCIFLESLSDAEAKVFLQKRTGCSTDDSNGHIAELVMELGGLPLALEQAGT